MYHLLNKLYLLSIAFGELEISKTFLWIIIGLTVFTFLAVGISSFKLVQSITEDKEK